MAPGAIIEAADYHGPYGGTFVPSLLAVGAAVGEQLGLRHVLVLPGEIADRPWVQDVRDAGYDPTFVPVGAGRGEATRILTEVARRENAALLRSHFTRFDMPAGIAARRSGARCVWNIHTGSGSYTPRQRATDLVKVRVLGRLLCQRVIAVSEGIAAEAREHGYPAARVTVVLNGIAVDRFAAATLAERADARAGLGLAEDDRVVLAFCWWPQIKGADVIADAVAQVQGGVTALLVGREDLEAFVTAHHAGPPPANLRVVAPLDDPRPFFAAADVFVSASRQEGFPFAIGEAMAAHLPIASSDIPGPAPYFDAPGLETFPSEDAPALARVLEDLLDPGRRAERGAANRAFVSERFGLQSHVDAVIGAFRRELGPGGG